MPLPTVVKTHEISIPVRGGMDEHSAFREVCPSGTSSHSKGWCKGRSLERVVITTTWSNRQQTRSFRDTWKCETCGTVRDQEWMPA